MYVLRASELHWVQHQISHVFGNTLQYQIYCLVAHETASWNPTTEAIPISCMDVPLMNWREMWRWLARRRPGSTGAVFFWTSVAWLLFALKNKSVSSANKICDIPGAHLQILIGEKWPRSSSSFIGTNCAPWPSFSTRPTLVHSILRSKSNQINLLSWAQYLLSHDPFFRVEQQYGYSTHTWWKEFGRLKQAETKPAWYEWLNFDPDTKWQKDLHSSLHLHYFSQLIPWYE